MHSHKFITIWSFVIWSKKLFLLSRFLLYGKPIPKILTVLVSKLTHSTPQSAIFTPFMTPIPATSHFYLLTLRPENWDIMLKLCKTSVTDFLFIKKGALVSICSTLKVIITEIQTFNVRALFYFNECYFQDDNESIRW